MDSEPPGLAKQSSVPTEAHDVLQAEEDEDARTSGPAQLEGSARGSTIRYGITDTPPWPLWILLACQTYLTMRVMLLRGRLGATVLIPSLLVPAMGGNTSDLANTICTCFMASGINTLLQTTLGARLPIVQGGSFAYISPVIIISADIQNANVFASDHDRFIYTMRVLQGGIIGSALIAFAAALLGAFLWLLRHLSPTTIAVNISILGLSLYASGWPAMGNCIQLGLPVLILITMFAFHLRRLTVFGLPVFSLFPVFLGLGLTWLYAFIFTVAGVYDSASPETQKACTTSQANFDYILDSAPWFRVPYPGQWGAPIFTWTAVLTMIAAIIPAALESIGDYYAAARLAGAPQPPPAVISRALTVETLCCVVAGLFGTTSGSTAYAENVGAIAITRVASRRVTQLAALLMIVVSCIGKFGALFASIPQALVAGMFTVMFSLIAGVGFSNLEGVSLVSERAIFTLGSGLFNGLSVPAYFESYTQANGHGPVNTGSSVFNNICNVIFQTPAAVALMTTMLLDLTVPREPGERASEATWQRKLSARSLLWWNKPEMERIYGLPWRLTPKWHAWADPKSAALRDWAGAALARLDPRRCWRARAERRRVGRQRKPSTQLSSAAAELPLAVVPAVP